MGEKPKLVFTEGAVYDGPTWEIHFDAEGSSYGGSQCKHGHSREVVVKTRRDGTTWQEEKWVVPRVVVAFNEAGYARTETCLDCILEVAASLDPGIPILATRNATDDVLGKPDGS